MLGLLALMGTALMASLIDTDEDDGDVAPEGVADTPPEEENLDLGASFVETDEGIVLERGADETGSLAVVYYYDDEDAGTNLAIETYEARFYLVPEEVDWSNLNWENQQDIPGASNFAGNSYELADFEETQQLELLGTIDLLSLAEDHAAGGAAERLSDVAQDAVAEMITSNAPFESYLLTATTDGDELISMLPADYIETRNGIPETVVTTDTTGTDAGDWLAAGSPGLTIDGGAGNDLLVGQVDNTTLIGGDGSDFLSMRRDMITDDPAFALVEGASAIGGLGDDTLSLESGEALGEAGNDRISILEGTASGGEGKDTIDTFGNWEVSVFGDSGNDNLQLNGSGTTGDGGAGDDRVNVGAGAVGFGGLGSDTLGVDRGGEADGGSGDDLFQVWDFLNSDDGPAVLTGGAGADVFDALVRNPFGDASAVPFMQITDFDPSEDVLQVGSWSSDYPIVSIDIEEDASGAFTDVRLTFDTSNQGLEAGIGLIRLDGVTGLTPADIVLVE